MDIEKQAALLAGNSTSIEVAPAVSEPVEPVERESKASEILSEMEERCGFDRAESSMDYKGSSANEEYVRNAIWNKYGEDEASVYQPCVQVKPRTEWLKHGFILKDKEEPLCWILTKRNGQMVNVAMWHFRQVESK